MENENNNAINQAPETKQEEVKVETSTPNPTPSPEPSPTPSDSPQPTNEVNNNNGDKKPKKLNQKQIIRIAILGIIVVIVTLSLVLGLNWNRWFNKQKTNLIFNSKTLTSDATDIVLNESVDVNIKVNDFYVGYGYTLPTKLESVDIDGVVLKDDQYKYEAGNLKIDAKYVTGKVTVTGEANAVNFESDSWSNIISFANRGLNDLHIRYGKNSLVGLEHSIELNNNASRRVRVIGEGHDRLFNEETSKPTNKAASLTFEFVESLFTSSYASSATTSASYATSLIKSKCEEIYGNLPSFLHDAIRPVYKYTASIETTTVESEYLFPLSYREINGYESSKQEYGIEESCYEYYLELESNKLADKRKKEDSYYLRTPNVLYSEEALAVSSSGETVDSVSYTTELGVAPAFAIGETTSFITDTWDNVAYFANYGLDELKTQYGRESFVGLEREVQFNDGSIHRVRVVGENHDMLSGSKNKVAALTFEFTSPVTEEQSYGGIATYSDSNIPTYLNEIFENFPKVLVDNIPYVAKKTVMYEGDIPASETTDERLFILSLREIGDVFFGSAEPYSLEEEAYEYYKNGPNLTEEGIMLANKKRNKNGIWYWLRSHYCLGEQAHVVDYTGRTFGILGSSVNTIVRPVNNIFQFYPAFSLGYDDQEVNFTNDTWENVCYHAEFGLDHLKEYYGIDSFIGYERKVALAGDVEPDVHTVRVIGENEDTTVDGKPTTLTFEFKTGITSVKGSRYFEDETIFPYFSDSVIRDYCNNQAFFTLPEVLRDSIKTVKKKTAILKEPGSYDIEETSDKMFALSRNEISDIYDENEVGKETYQRENATYSYYQQAKDMVRYKDNNDVHGYYWLRSPYLDFSGSGYMMSICINSIGVMSQLPATHLLAVAPAFAI